MTLEELEKIVAARSEASPEDSWTAKLLAKGPEKCAEKFGEEAIEAIAHGDKQSSKVVGRTIRDIALPDGTTIVTIAGDLAGTTGGGPAPVGAGITVNDATVGAYASASADAWGSVGGGVQFELAPGESVAELFVGVINGGGIGL